MEPVQCPLTSSLSDEVLLLIINNLTLVDIINLSQTCRKLDDLLKDRTICEHLKFKWNFQLGRLDFTKFLRNASRSLLITKLNFNDLYWVPSGIIRNIARPLVNLKELHVAGTNLSWTHLTEILTPARNLVALSWSWDHRIENASPKNKTQKEKNQFLDLSTKASMRNMDLECIEKALSGLKFLLIHIPSVTNFTSPTFAAHPGMSFFISKCKDLEHLWILAWPKTDGERKLMEIFGEDSFPEDFKLERLRTFTVRVMGVPRMYAPRLISSVIKDVAERNTSDEGDEKQLEHLWLDHPLLSGSPWSRIAFNRLRGTAGHLYPWPKLNLDHVQTLSLPLTEGAAKWWEGNSYAKVRHLQITDGLVHVKNLSNLFDGAKDLESILVKAFNVKLDWSRFVDLHPKLREVSVCQDGDFPYPEICIALGKLKGLKKLSLPLYSLLEIRNQGIVDNYRASLELDSDDDTPPGVFPNKTLVAQFEDSLFGKKVRVSMASKSKDPNLAISGVDLITQSCRDIEEFELGFSSKTRPGFMVVKSLSTLCKWKNLKKLTLEGAPVHDGRFLIDIAKSCRELQSLSLRYLGARAKCNYIEDLSTACRYLGSLKDLRLEQNYIGSTIRLLNSLRQCKSLQRFLLWANSNDQALDQQSCLALMESCPQLQILYITIGATPKNLCESIRKTIEKKYKGSRPGLHVVIRRGTTTDLDDDIQPTIYPSVHYREMVVFAPQICQQNDFNVI